MKTKVIQSGARALRNAHYIAWSRGAVMASAMLALWPEPVRRNFGLAVLAWGAVWSG